MYSDLLLMDYTMVLESIEACIPELEALEALELSSIDLFEQRTVPYETFDSIRV